MPCTHVIALSGLHVARLAVLLSGPALTEARQAGMDVIVKEAMANGRLMMTSSKRPDSGGSGAPAGGAAGASPPRLQRLRAAAEKVR